MYFLKFITYVFNCLLRYIVIHCILTMLYDKMTYTLAHNSMAIIPYASNKGSDMTAHPRSPATVFAVL